MHQWAAWKPTLLNSPFLPTCRRHQQSLQCCLFLRRSQEIPASKETSRLSGLTWRGLFPNQQFPSPEVGSGPGEMYFRGRATTVGTWGCKCCDQWGLDTLAASSPSLYCFHPFEQHKTGKKAYKCLYPAILSRHLLPGVMPWKNFVHFSTLPQLQQRCLCGSAAISQTCLLIAGGKERSNMPARLLKQVTQKTSVCSSQGSKMIAHRSWTEKT